MEMVAAALAYLLLPLALDNRYRLPTPITLDPDGYRVALPPELACPIRE